MEKVKCSVDINGDCVSLLPRNPCVCVDVQMDAHVWGREVSLRG